MNKTLSGENAHWFRFIRSVLVTVMSGIGLFLAPLPAQEVRSGETGSLSGQVISGDTGAPLGFAVVEVVGTGIQTVTERDGSFRLSNVPAGQRSVLVTYTGLAPNTLTANVTPGGDARIKVTLGATEVLTMEALTVTGERSGIAAAIQQQREAANTV